MGYKKQLLDHLEACVNAHEDCFQSYDDYVGYVIEELEVLFEGLQYDKEFKSEQ
jgi:hypothetical protein